MALETQLIEVPLGAGLREDVDPWRVDPPHAQVLENAVIRRGEAVAKVPGWTSVGSALSVGTEGARALVASDDAILLTSQNGAAVINTPAPGETLEQESVGAGFVGPAGVDTIPVASPRGAVLDVGVTYHAAADLFGVVYRELPDVANALDDTKLGGGHIVALAMTPEGRIVAGPYRWNQDSSVIAGDRVLVLPRIEVASQSDGDAFFVVTFLESNDATSGLIDGQVNHAVYAAAWSMGSVPSSAPLPLLVGSTDRNALCYDTHSVSDHDATYIVTILGGALNVFRVDADAGTISSRTVGTNQAYQKPQVFHHDPSRTVVVTEAGNGTVFCLPENITADTSATGLHAESTPRLYVLASSTSAQLIYSGEQMTIVGSNPGTITPTGTTSLSVPEKCWDPQAWTGNAALFIAARQGEYINPENAVFGTPGTIVGDEVVGEFWPSTLEASLTHTDGQFRETFPLLSSKLPTIVYEGVYSDPRGGVEDIGHAPQTCLDGAGRVVLGQAFAIASRRAYKGRPEVLYPEEQNDGGMPNQDRRIVLIRCSPNQGDAVRSEVDHAGSRILAHGGVKVWDGVGLFDFVPQPKISAYRRGITTPKSGIKFAAMANVPESFASFPSGSAATLCLMRAVLVYVDRHGTEWRSPPSPPIAIYNTYLDANDLPRIELGIDSWAGKRLADTRGLDVEIYVTPRGKPDTTHSGAYGGYEFLDPGTNDVTQVDGTYYLTQRTPLLEDGDGYYVPDFLYVEQAGHTPYLATIPLYTSAGELAPYPPPASGVVARSGNYAFLVPSEFPYEFWASKPLEAGRGPEFAPELVLNVPTDSGGIVSLGAVGDRLFLFCRNGVYALSTLSGPDASGAGSFGVLRLVHRGDGCINHMLTVSTPHGVFYASENGIRLAALDGMVRDIGQPAKDTIGDVSRFVRGIYDRAEDEVVYFAGTGTGVRFNVRTEAWTSFERAEPMLDACRPQRAQRIYTTREAINQLHAEDPSEGTDNAQGMELRYVSPWLTFNQSMGFFRGRKVHALLRRVSGTGDIRVTLSYDYTDTVVDTFIFPFADLFDISSPERAGHLTVRPSRQKFDAIRVGIRDSSYQSSSQGEVFTAQSDLVWSIAGLSIEIGSKRGGIKLRAAQQSRTNALGPL